MDTSDQNCDPYDQDREVKRPRSLWGKIDPVLVPLFKGILEVFRHIRLAEEQAYHAGKDDRLIESIDKLERKIKERLE